MRIDDPTSPVWRLVGGLFYDSRMLSVLGGVVTDE